MSEADNLYAGETGFQSRRALVDKSGYLGDRDGDVVFDAGAEFALGSGNIFTQGPQIGAFLLGLSQDTVFPSVSIEKFGKFFIQFSIGNGVCKFNQNMPFRIGRLFELTEFRR